MSTLSIERSQAIQLHKTGGKDEQKLLEKMFGKQAFIEADWKVESFEDACDRLKRKPEEAIPFHSPADDFQKALNASAKLILIAEAIQGDYKANWSDSNPKWRPWFHWNGSAFVFSCSICVYGNTYTGCGSRLVFDTEEKSDYFGQAFIDLYNEFLTQK